MTTPNALFKAQTVEQSAQIIKSNRRVGCATEQPGECLSCAHGHIVTRSCEIPNGLLQVVQAKRASDQLQRGLVEFFREVFLQRLLECGDLRRGAGEQGHR